MSIVIMVGGTSANGNAEHRYLVDAFLRQYGDQVTRIITCEPQPDMAKATVQTESCFLIVCLAMFL